MGFLRNRFSEASTYAGLLALIPSLMQLAANPRSPEAISATVGGALAILLPDNIKQKIAGQ